MDGCEFNGKNISVTFAQSDRKCKHTSLLRLVLDSFRLSFIVFGLGICTLGSSNRTASFENQPKNIFRVGWRLCFFSLNFKRNRWLMICFVSLEFIKNVPNAKKSHYLRLFIEILSFRLISHKIWVITNFLQQKRRWQMEPMPWIWKLKC